MPPLVSDRFRSDKKDKAVLCEDFVTKESVRELSASNGDILHERFDFTQGLAQGAVAEVALAHT